MSNIKPVSAYEFTKSSNIEFSKEVNLRRHIPSIYDGLKPSYRKVLYSMYELPDKYNKLVKIAGHTIAEYHGHGDKSLYPVIKVLENLGIVDGNQGNFGYTPIYGKSCGAAAPRYIEAKLTLKYRNMFSEVLKLVPTEVSEVGGVMPKYLPTPIPLGLTIGYNGLGYGCRADIPSFTVTSLAKAYLNNDYNLLVHNSNNLMLPNSELESLWLTGRGRIYFSYKVVPIDKGFRIYGSPESHRIDFSTINKWFNDNLIDISESNDSGVKCLTITLAKKVRKLTISELEKEIRKITKWSEYYIIRVVRGEQVIPIGIYSWIKHTYENYIKLAQELKSSNIRTIENNIKALDYMEPVVKFILQHPGTSSEEIEKSTKISHSIVKLLLSKPISTLLNMNKESSKKSLLKSLDSWKNYDPDKRTLKLIESL